VAAEYHVFIPARKSSAVTGVDWGMLAYVFDVVKWSWWTLHYCSRYQRISM